MARLARNTQIVRQGLQDAGIPVIPGDTPIVPVLVGEAERATAIDFKLREAGILLSAIRPPTVAPGASRLRFTVTAGHAEEQLRRAVAKLIEVWNETR